MPSFHLWIVFAVTAVTVFQHHPTFAAEDEVIRICPLKSNSTINTCLDSKEAGLHIYCHDPLPRSLWNIWTSCELVIEGMDDMVLFSGDDEKAVEKRTNQVWNWLTPSYGEDHPAKITLPSFRRFCIGIDIPRTAINFEGQYYRFVLIVKNVDLYYAVVLALGIFLLFTAPQLARQALFYYVSCISLGVLASILLLVFLMSRYIPKRAAAVFLLLGTSTALWLVQLFLENMRGVFTHYSSYLFTYILITGFISFAIAYKRGPVSDPKTIDLIKWSIQIVGIVLILNSSEMHEVSFLLLLIILFIYNFPRSILNCLKWRLWRSKSAPRPRLLTEDEYLLQAEIETNKALEELRKYCRSPNCNTWKVVRRIKSPERFAKFVEGDSHLDDEELSEYENFLYRSNLRLPNDRSLTSRKRSPVSSSTVSSASKKNGKRPLGLNDRDDSDLEINLNLSDMEEQNGDSSDGSLSAGNAS